MYLDESRLGTEVGSIQARWMRKVNGCQAPRRTHWPRCDQTRLWCRCRPWRRMGPLENLTHNMRCRLGRSSAGHCDLVSEKEKKECTEKRKVRGPSGKVLNDRQLSTPLTEYS